MLVIKHHGGAIRHSIQLHTSTLGLRAAEEAGASYGTSSNGYKDPKCMPSLHADFTDTLPIDWYSQCSCGTEHQAFLGSLRGLQPLPH